jgi:hypothetical protein
MTRTQQRQKLLGASSALYAELTLRSFEFKNQVVE